MTHRQTDDLKSFAAIFHYRHRYWAVCSVVQWDYKWQVLCVVWFSFTDVQFSLSCSAFCTPTPPPPPPPLSHSPLIWWKSMAPLCPGRAWCLLMKSYLLWVIHLMGCWASDGLKDPIFSILLHPHKHVRGHIHPCKRKCVACWRKLRQFNRQM